ncbi:MAG TPA: LysR family transcriptional regulator [Dongiaceae bacterium]|nr:LysR family transcriptional regulator [Dongiaceae bacterium]
MEAAGDNRRYTSVFPKQCFGAGGMDRLTSMAVFKRAVEAGSFAAAARHFGISPEMAGNHVRALESHLGVRLLNRSTRRLHLTEAGSSYYERCARILAEIEEADAEAGSQQLAPHGPLRIAAPMTFGVLHLGPAIGEYMARYPSVKVDVSLSDRRVNVIDEGFDLAIRIGDISESALVVRRLASARLVLCASPAYLAHAGRPEKPTDLTRHACLIYSDLRSPRSWRFTSADGRTDTVQVVGPFTSNNPHLMVSLALAGHGLIYWPSFAVGAEILAGRLVPLLMDWRSRELTIRALYPHRALLSAKVRSFVDFLVERFGPEPEWDRWQQRTDMPAP